MSEAVKCDGCGASGYRRRMHPAPEDWLYIEATDEDAEDPVAGTTFVYACSATCAAAMWKRGPGPSFDEPESSK